MNQLQLIEIAKRYYPRDIASDHNFKTSSERQALSRMWERAMRDDHARWQETVKAIQNELPGITVADTTAPGHGGSFRCVVYVKELPLLGGASLETMVAGFRSVLAPIYGVAWIQRVGSPSGVPWKAASLEIPEELLLYANVIGKHVGRAEQLQQLPKELAEVRVPEIFVEHRAIGEATLFDALLDPYPENQP